MKLNHILNPRETLREAITQHYHIDEGIYVDTLLSYLNYNDDIEAQIAALAREFVQGVREKEMKKRGVEALMVHYDLSTQEGIMLMCLAEALLRIPDTQTEDLLIRDKLTSAHWSSHLGKAESSFVNLATWGLALTGKVLDHDPQAGTFTKLWKGLLQRSGEPVIRTAVREAIKVMSEQFVLGRTIKEALKRSEPGIEKGYSYSYDMLGEAARTLPDAAAYYEAYSAAIQSVESTINPDMPILKRPSISVKLSALYPRYEFAHQADAVVHLSAQLKSLCLLAKSVGICLTVDAEEADRLDMSLDIIEKVYRDPELGTWDGFGIAIQAYQKRAMSVIRWVAELADTVGRRFRIRLVKGAYWDTEIKVAQELGHRNYPVFTRKVATDVSYLACAKFMLSDAAKNIYPQFATHNAYTVAAIIKMMHDGQKTDCEFQSLHGMGGALHDELIQQGYNCRVYAPVGSHEDLLPYLVRRLLENGANSSFVNQIADKDTPIESLIESPVETLKAFEIKANPKIPLPIDIFGEVRKNSLGIDFTDTDSLRHLQMAMQPFWQQSYQAVPALRPIKKTEDTQPVLNPSNHSDVVGQQVLATENDMKQAIENAHVAFTDWMGQSVDTRAAILEKIADLLIEHQAELMTLTMREAGKVLTDAIAEIREAVDFCRYYAQMARETLSPIVMPGYTGETNTLRMQGRGVMLCISPWNFPVAIFTGQVVAALVAGNAVIAKPAEQTALIAAKVVELCYKAGIPKAVLQYLPGSGSEIGKVLLPDDRIAGVIFTGSTATAKIIQQSLADRSGPIVPFIAETGGINAMIADSTALPEQLTDDVVMSAFGSAGQRCSALRLLLVQSDIADDVIEMIRGAMALLVVGDPLDLATDVGPVIDKDAQKRLNDHIQTLKGSAQLIGHAKWSEAVDADSTYVLPHAFELNAISDLKAEFFGPILHVVRYDRKSLDSVIEAINNLGYGLTFGIQSRIDEQVEYIQSRIRVGNIYVNRNIIGAMVGVQPFGGRGLSGTGPKAGGPHYLLRLCTESTLTINTTAAGGNASLMALD